MSVRRQVTIMKYIKLSVLLTALGIVVIIGTGITALVVTDSSDSISDAPVPGEAALPRPAPDPEVQDPSADATVGAGPLSETAFRSAETSADVENNEAASADDSRPTTAEPARAAVTAPHPAPVSEAQTAATNVTIQPDPDFERALLNAGISRRGWETDFSRHTVPYGEILSGGPPRDGIPPLDDPKFTTAKDASAWLGDQEPVIAFELNDDARAYPLQILTWHEIVNDLVGGVPVSATFCPLCNAAIVFDRRLDGTVYDFGTSGNLRNSDLIMWDRQTESWWQQFTGQGIVGELAGKKLTMLTASIISFSDFRAASPDGKVLSRDTGFSRPYPESTEGHRWTA